MTSHHSRYDVLRAIYQINARMSLLHALQGIDISRCFEYTEAYKQIAPSGPNVRVLDVGSYRSPFPAFLASRGHDVTVVDLHPAVGRQARWISRSLGPEARVKVHVADVAALPFSKGAFDAVTCISTLEHIPGDRDSLAVREIARVLRAGGVCFISVPYSTRAREGRWRRWFQRWFDVDMALARLVEPSGLSLVEKGFLMGGPIGGLADVWYRVPAPLRHTLSWSHVLLFPRAFELDQARENDARVMWLMLEKREKAHASNP
ncbi:MAG: class I SAM-dependent methyltransferase [Chloroflexota bacterium]|nr:class I SAM-dependent methyltransferase [Chloroflexota bacterium]